MRYGRLTLLSEPYLDGSKHSRRLAHCRCDCGTEKVIRLDGLQSGAVTSCGCWHKERVTTHGRTLTREYKIWRGMLDRCQEPTNKDYPRYGGRGIQICKRWQSFETFFADMGESNGLQLERKDNDKGYEPNNCVWATVKQQARNRRSNFIFTYEGITACLAEHCERLGVEPKRTWMRIKLGWSLDQAFKGKSN